MNDPTHPRYLPRWSDDAILDWLCEQYEPVTCQAVANVAGMTVRTALRVMERLRHAQKVARVDDAKRPTEPSLWVAL